MRISVCLACDNPLEPFIEHVRQIEDLGFDGLWLTDLGLKAADVFPYLTVALTQSSRLWIGSAVHPTQMRHPAVTLNALATLDAMSPGRVVYGIGSGSPEFVNSIGRRVLNLSAMRELVTLSRSLMNGESVNCETPELTMRNASLSRVCKMPIYIAATGPKILALSGEIADGIIAHVGAAREAIEQVLASCAEGQAARSLPAPVDVAPYLYTSVSKDRHQTWVDCMKGARTVAVRAPHLARAAGCSLDEEQRLGQSGGDIDDIISQRLIDKLTLSGTVSDCLRKLEGIADLGIGHVIIYPRGDNLSETIATFGREILPALT